MATDTHRPPFGATVDGVTALVPEARLLDTAPTPGKYGITVAQVEAWIDQLSGRVAMRLDGWQRLSTNVVAPETDSDRDQFLAYARDLVHNGAASYVEAARFPERAAVADTSYAGVLWQRFTTGLDELAAWLERRLLAGATGDEPAPAAALTVDYAFPAPLFPDGLRF